MGQTSSIPLEIQLPERLTDLPFSSDLSLKSPSPGGGHLLLLLF